MKKYLGVLVVSLMALSLPVIAGGAGTDHKMDDKKKEEVKEKAEKAKDKMKEEVKEMKKEEPAKK